MNVNPEPNTLNPIEKKDNPEPEVDQVHDQTEVGGTKKTNWVGRGVVLSHNGEDRLQLRG